MSVRDSSSEDTSTAGTHANHRYYLDTGVGSWSGTFTFTVTDWEAFWNDRIGIVNRVLVISMACVMWLVGEARITSVLEGFPDEPPHGVVTNEVRITLWGITLYLLSERYVLHPDGRGVTVDSTERFGPIPFLFTVEKAHPAEVVEGAGVRSITCPCSAPTGSAATRSKGTVIASSPA